MSTKKENTGLKFSDYLKYFGGKSSNREKHAFERKIMQDPFDEEAFDGISEIDKNDFEKDIKDIERKLFNKKSRKYPVYFGMAAAVLVLLISGYFIYDLSRNLKKEDKIAQHVEMTKEKEIKPAEEVVQSEMIENNKEPKKKSIVKKEVETVEYKTERAASPQISMSDQKNVTVSDKSDSKKETGKVLSENVPAMKMSKNDELLLMDEELKPLEYTVESGDEQTTEKQPEISSTVTEALQGRLAGVDVNKRKMNSMVRAKPVKLTENNKVEVKGKVIDVFDKSPLPGVNVVEKGTNNGTVTDVDGNFTLEVDKGSELVIAFIGYLSEELKIDNNEFREIPLTQDMMALDEVVVVGYGTESSSEIDNTFEAAHPPMKNKNYDIFILSKLDSNLVNSFVDEVVRVEFIVATDGTLSQFKTLKTPDQQLADDIIKIIQNGPAWNPSKSGNIPRESKVRFKLKISK